MNKIYKIQKTNTGKYFICFPKYFINILEFKKGDKISFKLNLDEKIIKLKNCENIKYYEDFFK